MIIIKYNTVSEFRRTKKKKTQETLRVRKQLLKGRLFLAMLLNGVKKFSPKKNRWILYYLKEVS